MMQRKSIQNAVDRGDSLPPPSRAQRTNSKKNTQVTFPCYWKKRSQEVILNSGAYDRDQYRRTAPLRESQIFDEKKKKNIKANINNFENSFDGKLLRCS